MTAPPAIPVPVVCLGCSRMFAIYNFAGSAEITLSGCVAGPCPFCGAQGFIPEGTYSHLSGAVETLVGKGATPDVIDRLQQILSEASVAHATAEDIAARIEQEVPALKAVADAIKANKSFAMQIVSFLLTVLALIMSRYPPAPQRQPLDPTKVVRDVFDQIHAEAQRDAAATVKAAPINQAKKVGRNDPCSCGSGVKYKKCHGR